MKKKVVLILAAALFLVGIPSAFAAASPYPTDYLKGKSYTYGSTTSTNATDRVDTTYNTLSTSPSELVTYNFTGTVFVNAAWLRGRGNGTITVTLTYSTGSTSAKTIQYQDASNKKEKEVTFTENNLPVSKITIKGDSIGQWLYEFDVSTYSETEPPAQVTGLSGNAGNGKVYLNWTANTESDLAGYKIYMDGVLKDSSSINSATISGIANGTAHSFAVAAFDTSNNIGVKSSAISLTPFAPPIDPPGHLAQVTSSGRVDLTWDAVTDAIGYNVYRNGVKVNASPITAASYTATGLQDNTVYKWYVKAINNSGTESPESNTVTTSFTINAPTNLTASPSSEKVVLNWTGVKDAASYNVYRNGAKFNSSPITATSYTVAATNNTNYSWYVKAVSESGTESDASNMVTTLFDTISPLAPIGLSVNGKTTDVGNTSSVILKWTASTEPDLAGYNVYHLPSEKLNGALVTVTQYTVTGITANEKYGFAVTAVDTSGNESGKSSSVFYTYDTQPPNPPTELKATPGSGSMKLTFKASTSSDASKYRIYQDGQPIATITGTSFDIQGLASNKSYKFAVTAIDDVGNESEQVSISATTLEITKPEAVDVTPGNGKVTISWAAVPGAIKYVVYRNGEQLVEVNGTSYTDSTVENGVKYTYTVTAVKADGTETEASGPVDAKPSKEITNFTGSSLPFSVWGMIMTAFHFLKLNSSWLLIVLGVLFAPILIGIAAALTGKTGKEAAKTGKGKRKRSGSAGKRSGSSGKRTGTARDKASTSSKGERVAQAAKVAKQQSDKPKRSREGLIAKSIPAERNGKKYMTTVYVKPENYKQGNVIDMRTKKKG